MVKCSFARLGWISRGHARQVSRLLYWAICWQIPMGLSQPEVGRALCRNRGRCDAYLCRGRTVQQQSDHHPRLYFTGPSYSRPCQSKIKTNIFSTSSPPAQHDGPRRLRQHGKLGFCKAYELRCDGRGYYDEGWFVHT